VTIRVLVTRPAGTWPTLEARFHGTAVQIQLAETTSEVDAIDPRPGDEALGRLDCYDWLVATSGRGVAALSRRLASRGVTAVPAGLRFAAVGAATARALAGIGARVELVAEDASSEGLAASLGPRLSAGSRVVIVRPEGATGLLAAALRAWGAEVDEAPLYRTVASDRAVELADAAISGAFSAVVLTAPSSLDRWLDAAGARREALIVALRRVARVAIGPTTAAHLLSLDLPADAVADAPTEDAVGDAIARVLGL
jgi:uroporphyrinogen III methyltransferase / synthase